MGRSKAGVKMGIGGRQPPRRHTYQLMRQRGARTLLPRVVQGRGVGQDGKDRRKGEPHTSQVLGDLDALVSGVHPIGLPLTSWDLSPGLFDTKP